ncbi:MAG: hypothetical protein M0Z33_11950 [Actinomycetota bacterium]|nr:hypothetical protein [Actinomycetota bacterium]
MDDTTTYRPTRIALVGDRSETIRAHAKIPSLLDPLSSSGSPRLEIYWIHSNEAHDAACLGGFDGIWVIPGSPYESAAGVLAAIEVARTEGIPFLGTCGGFQHALLEFARDVCALTEAANAEESPDAELLLITPLECSLLGEEAEIVVAPGTLAASLMGPGRRTERFFCRYGLNTEFRSLLESRGMVFSATDTNDDPRVAELPGHPHFLASLFQPELASDATWVHPVIVGFVAAARARSGAALETTA